MIIQDLFLYFAQFPRREGLNAMFTMGASSYSEYSFLQSELCDLEKHSLVPDIENYVYGQSFEDLQQRVSRLIGSWLYVDYGEFTARDSHGSMDVSQRIAVTVAIRLSQNADMAERMIASDRALAMLSKVHAHMMADAERGHIDWLMREDILKAEIVPFVATELSSFGWTLFVNATAPDMLGTHEMTKTILRHNL